MFSAVFESALCDARRVSFSAHARQRMARRGIEFSRADQGRISRALDEAAAKGSRESLLIMDRCALLASVPNRLVITVVPSNELADTVFTNIDSAVVVAQAATAPPSVDETGPDPTRGSPRAAE